MGMVACFTSLSSEALLELQEEPDRIEAYLSPDDGESEPPNYLDLDKAWHGIHYLLTGLADGGTQPQSLAVIGGQEFGPEVGYGPARFLTPQQVRSVATSLSGISEEALSQRFNPKDMEAKQIYPDAIWVRDGQEALDYALENYRQLQVFYQDAAARGDVVIQWLS
ncbi:YfbM family protein [Polaromonas aquatica]|uniref:YfbM family protein n=1 Tax=Polaromonas aquatica TaxID=332657 RepID=UPI003D650B0A